MVPDNEPLSAFAVYSGQNGSTRNSRKKKKLRAKKSMNKVVTLSKDDKKKILKKKREKIETITMKKDTTAGASKEEPKAMKLAEKKKIKKAKKHKIEPESDSKKKKAKSKEDKSFSLFSTKTSTPSSIHSEEHPGIIQQVTNLRMEKEASASTSKRRKSALLDKAKTFALQQKNSVVTGMETLGRLISPMTVDNFMKDFWEKAPVYIPSTNAQKFGKLMSTPMMDEILRENVMAFGRDVDVTTYTDGVRETHNPESRAQAHVVWDYYSNGCSVRFLSPQSYSPHLHTLNSTLQEYFGSFVGANVYLTPPNSQGFAPHFDDIEAFVLQIEGKKKWKVYQPRSRSETLPRFSSKNFKPEELTEPPVLEVTLKPGDVLYFPRGFIHQARTLHNEHSLHITISVYQKTAWCDLLEKAVPQALQAAIADDLDFRRGLPINYLKQAGFAHKNVTERKQLIQTLKKLVSKLVNYVNIDQAVDEMGAQFMHDALPPVLSVEEASCSVVGNGLRMEENGRLRNRVEVTPDSRVRIIRANCSRFVTENVKSEDGTVETQFRLYLSIDNPKEYHQEEPQYLILPETMVDAMKFLINTYPSFTAVNKLPCQTDDDKMLLVTDLWDRGVLVTETPFDEVAEEDTLQSIIDDLSGDENEEDEEEEQNENRDVSDISSILKEMAADEEFNESDENLPNPKDTKHPKKKGKTLKFTPVENMSEDEESDKSNDESTYFLCDDSSSDNQVE